MNRFLDPYYFANTILLLVYGGLRAYFVHLTPEGSQHSRFQDLQDFAVWEKQAMLVVLATVMFKGLRRRSWDDTAQQVFFVGKIIVAVTAIRVDVRLGVLYALLAAACWVVCPQPIMQMTRGKDEDKVVLLTPTLMREYVLRGEDDWVVFFYTENHAGSIASAPAFVEVAHEYWSEALSFGVMDACLWPGFCKELKLRPQGWSSQLPAVVRYVRGKEQARLPAPGAGDEMGLRPNFISQKEIINKLSLNGAPYTSKGGKKQR